MPDNVRPPKLTSRGTILGRNPRELLERVQDIDGNRQRLLENLAALVNRPNVNVKYLCEVARVTTDDIETVKQKVHLASENGEEFAKEKRIAAYFRFNDIALLFVKDIQPLIKQEH